MLPTLDDMDFAALVRQWKAATGVMYKVVAARAEMQPNKLSDIANGKNLNPEWSTIQRIAAGFGVTVAQFIAGPANKVTPAEVPEAGPGHVLPHLRAPAPSASDSNPARAVKHGGDHDAEVQTSNAAAPLTAAVARLEAAVAAINAVTARAALADARRQAAATRHPRPARRRGARKHR